MLTTFTRYGQVLSHRQGELICATLEGDLKAEQVAALEVLLAMTKDAKPSVPSGASNR